MTESQQHQEPVKHAEEHAESAIMAAQRAEAMLQDALVSADPKLIQAAQARLDTAQHDGTEALKHLTEYHYTEKYQQQLEQTSDELRQASQDLEAAQRDAVMPRQVR
jgi:hypothetical protein